MRLTGALAIVATAALAAAPPAVAAGLPAIKHVFVIVLENKGFDETFSATSKSPYLAREVPKLGETFRNYYGTGHFSLTNYMALVSGQAPTTDTQNDCFAAYNDVTPGTPAADGQVTGNGCVYPASVKTVADQLTAKGLTWKAYMEDMGTPCRHPAPGAADTTLRVTPGDQYAGRHNPFIYFHSIVDTPACNTNDVDFSNFTADIADASKTPNYSFITPNVCDDGHDGPCVDQRPGGLASADAFLKTWVPKIMGSPGYKDNGMIVVTFDEAEISDSTACCNEPSGPNVTMPGRDGPGGGRVGTVFISSFVPPGTVNDTPVNHYSLLRGVEDLFGLSPLGYATTAPVIDSVYDMTRPQSAVFAEPPPTTTTTVAAAAAPARPELPRTGGNTLALLALGAGAITGGLAMTAPWRRGRRGAGSR